MTFSKIKRTDYDNSIDPLYDLLIDKANDSSDEMLNMKVKKLENHYDLKPTDDIAIIRMIEE